MTDFMPPTSKERGLRSGTVPTPLVVGLGAACELANREMEYDHQHVKRLSDMLVQVKMMVVMIYNDGDHQDGGDIQMENYNQLLPWISPHFDDDLTPLGRDQSIAKCGEKWRRKCLPWVCQPQLPLC